MSAWSGIAAAGVALALAFFTVGQPIWEWRVSDPNEVETWSYGVFGGHHIVENKTTRTTTDEPFSYGTIAGQERLSAVFETFGQTFLLGVLAAVAGIGLSAATAARKLRGLFAGVVLLLGCIFMFFAALDLVIVLPTAASDLASSIGQPLQEFRGQFQITQGNVQTLVTYGPMTGWFLMLALGIVFAFGSSETWHLRPRKKIAPETKAATPQVEEELPPPPPVELISETPAEPEIEEVFVIAPSGLLVKHMSRSLMSDKDRDVVGGMISVVSNFVQEAFSERDGEVHEMTMGQHRFVMCRDNSVVIAALVGEGDTEDIMHRIRHLLVCLLDRYGHRLTSWDGKPLEGIEDELEVLWEPFHIPPPPVD